MAAQSIDSTRPRTLADLYVDRDLTQAQVRRLVALLGLSVPRGATAGSDDKAA
ncbi:hypothetical protein [Streptomyces sp. NBC_00151]|uniref:hypothetical protein n=1 Tax=Streptomyces sp. NBC_00151 TaxID=2975669 RepID=UPI002DD92837|nr:hypothetical protein [Streptomyces sp. NBC_00151]WRZ41865.1 hypothetical protein OG915_29800 [Streptomyces sp. NBC_00151]